MPPGGYGYVSGHDTEAYGPGVYGHAGGYEMDGYGYEGGYDERRTSQPDGYAAGTHW